LSVILLKNNAKAILFDGLEEKYQYVAYS
jgi:hypothetical protein